MFRVLVVLVLATVAAGASSAPRAASPCFDGAIVSLRSGVTLHRYHARDGGLVRASATRVPVLPGEDAVADGNGGWYISGFGLARLRGDGQLDTSWHPPLRRHLALWTLARAGGRLFVSDGQRVYAVEERSGNVLWASGTIGGGSMRRIFAVVATPSTVFVGGAFKRFGSVTRGQLAALSASSGRVLPWHAPVLKPYTPTTSRSVQTLALGPGSLYFAGSFSGVGGAARGGGVAAVRLRDGRLTKFAPSAGTIGTLALAVVHGNALIGGGDIGGVFDAETGKLRHHSSIIGVAIAARGWRAYVGGNFRNDIGLHNLLAVDVHTGDNLKWFPNIAREVGVAKIALSGDKAFVGGQFCARL
ncbi:MAG TPA: hypothetical protein VLK24_03455 [Gaiellaceae bacterium]|nr:hypothetical protein [Gaiellaceae bacterium]